MMSEEQSNWFFKRFMVGMVTLLIVLAIRDYGWNFFFALGMIIGAPVACVLVGTLLLGAFTWFKNNWY